MASWEPTMEYQMGCGKWVPVSVVRQPTPDNATYHIDLGPEFKRKGLASERVDCTRDRLRNLGGPLPEGWEAIWSAEYNICFYWSPISGISMD